MHVCVRVQMATVRDTVATMGDEQMYDGSLIPIQDLLVRGYVGGERICG